MNKIFTAASVAALLSVSAYSAIAQDAAVGVDAGAGVSVDTPALDANAGASTNAGASAATNANANANANGNADNTYGSLMSSMNGSANVDFAAITDEASVTIVTVSSLEGDAATEGAALDNAISSSADAMTSLHTNVSGNATITAKLEAEGYTADDVVAIKSNADGSVVVYVDDRG